MKSSLCIQILLPSVYFPNVMKLGCKYFVSTIWTCVFMYLFCNCKHVTLVRRPHVRRPHVRQHLPKSGYASIILGWQLKHKLKKCVFLKNFSSDFFRGCYFCIYLQTNHNILCLPFYFPYSLDLASLKWC